jgi:putative phage-type endonuclease
METLDLVQGSQEWLAARNGSLGASRVSDALARTKTGWGASRSNLMAALICERLTGQPQDTFTNAAMEWGTATEPQARLAYEFQMNADVCPVGLIRHPTIAGTHASPDGLTKDEGLIEIKCPNTATHIETLLGEGIAGKYVTQMQWQMACTGRKWCDFVSFDPRLPVDMQLFIQRVNRDDTAIAEMETEVRKFLAELSAKIEALNAKYKVAA